ncbi:phage portal protein [Clostridium nigeriense]|uniref:phage portal protein n=1 Tax=Clostridium nigeriense TaxID=1805470 RepID=UPI003D35534A
MGIFSFTKREASNSNGLRIDNSEKELRDVLLQDSDEELNTELIVTRNNVMEIPSVASGINIISSLVASLPIKMYELKDGNVVEITEDNRLNLLNLSSEKTMSAYQMKKEFIKDYLLHGNGYIYVNKPDEYDNRIESLHYVKESNISFLSNFDPIFKDMKVMVNGQSYESYDFIILTQNSSDGVSGKGLIQNNQELLSTMLTSLQREKNLAKTGGVNRGILKSAKKLSKEAMDALKMAWKKLYSGNNNAMVLNDGVDFVTVSQTSKDMELYNNKTANNKLVNQILNIPISIIEGTASDAEFNNWIKVSINPILTQLETALNISLLFAGEVGNKFFSIDTDEILKSDIEKRYKSYEIGLKNGFLKIDEVRRFENMEAIPNIGGLVRMTQGEVLYNPETDEVFNTNSSTKTQLDVKEGGEVLNEVTT